MRALLDDIHTVAWDHPGHGRGPTLELPVAWRGFGEYVLDLTERGGVGVGHSMGAAALAMAQAADPQRFRALVLIEPIVFPGPYRREERDSMSVTAEKRKAFFGSREAAAENFRGKWPFEHWHQEAFDGYIECALIGDDEVHGHVPACNGKRCGHGCRALMRLVSLGLSRWLVSGRRRGRLPLDTDQPGESGVE